MSGRAWSFSFIWPSVQHLFTELHDDPGAVLRLGALNETESMWSLCFGDIFSWATFLQLLAAGYLSTCPKGWSPKSTRKKKFKSGKIV